MAQSFEFEIEVNVSAKRMWWGVCKDAHNCLPKCLPHKIASVEYPEGKPVETGCVRVIKFHKGHHDFLHLKEKLEVVDDEKLKLEATCIEGGFLGIFFKHYKYKLEFKEGVHEASSKIHCFVEYVALGEHHVAEAVKAEASKIGDEIKEGVEKTKKAIKEEVLKVEDKIKEGKAKVEEKVCEEKAKIEEKVCEEKAKVEEEVCEERVKVEHKIEEGKAKAEEKVCEEKVKVEEEVCEEKVKVERGQIKIKEEVTSICKSVEGYLIVNKEYYSETHIATYKYY